ncbi:putative glycosyltransferase [Desulfosporosinus acidiphilus SJ4]|uniref:Putative glycosyltransferase n=1 Tax=Desulfosporosinus acidiphilus (strain DSM 22704 / JCM 16185 / SJ4) TaxID=646529 RepID=I4D443_DESAJ|nr:flagellar brake domain-containing protein [Desulfosporosinus acidiphilus]AFM40567.1 putative glycosyltransferase [Desulfosporosinus acidiphilus SJ4]
MSFSQFHKKLSPGLSIILEVLEGEYKGKYRSRIEEVEEMFITVGAPFVKGDLIPLRLGMELNVVFWDEISAYSFSTKIVKRAADPIYILVLDMPGTIVKTQRRNYVRVTSIFPLIFQLPSEGLSKNYKGTMLDFSGGGIRFLTEKHVEEESILNVHLEFAKEGIATKVRVVRTEEIEDSKPKRYRVSAEFVEISERTRDQIIRHIFEIQRTLRKKGLE